MQKLTRDGAVDASTPGNYPLTYWAEDHAGNRASLTRRVTVSAPAPSQPPEPTVAPEPTVSPELTLSPTLEPAFTPGPDPTAVPDRTASPVPSATPRPTRTPRPERPVNPARPTAAPEATPQPAASEPPQPTAQPSVSPTAAPQPSVQPSPTPSPVPSQRPAATPTPEPSAAPVPTAKPHPTAIPAPSATPAPTIVPSAAPTPIPVVPFEDVSDRAYYFDAVCWAVSRGITTGVSETAFAPETSCTRAQAVTFLWRAAGQPASSLTISPFSDVQDRTAYYYPAVLWAYENGVTTGTGPTHFSPDETCTRAQIVTFLWRAQGNTAFEEDIPFRDVDQAAYYAEAVRWAVEQSVTTGTSPTAFSPENDCTRAQIVTFLWRADAIPSDAVQADSA